MQTPGKQQLRTSETRARLLGAAEQVFVRDGYESAQLEEITKTAGRSKGAVYTHFKSKEDLFLALYEHQTRAHVNRLVSSIQKCTSRRDAIDAFRKFFIGLSDDKKWPILTLEFKLFALRHPESKERFRNVFKLATTTEHSGTDELLFGRLSRAEKTKLDQALLSLGPVVSGLILESYFEPEVFSEKGIRGILGRIFDALIQPRG